MSDLDPTVFYAPAPVHVGYLVGSDGSAWTCKDRNGVLTYRWRRLTEMVNRDGYCSVHFCEDRKQTTWQLSRLVLTAFVGPCPPGCEACHIDDDRGNNRIENLKWDTHENNIRQRNERSRQSRGERNGSAKLTEADVRRVRELHAQHIGHRRIADMLNVSRGPILKIIQGKTWTHVT